MLEETLIVVFMIKSEKLKFLQLEGMSVLTALLTSIPLSGRHRPCSVKAERKFPNVTLKIQYVIPWTDRNGRQSHVKGNHVDLY